MDPVRLWLVNAKMPSTMKPKWLIDVYAMNRMMSRLPIAKMAPYKIEMVARTSTTGVAHWLASGNRPRQNLIMPKVPILSITPTIMVALPAWTPRPHPAAVCSGTSGALIANANMKPTNNQRPVPVSQVAQRAQQIAWLSRPGRLYVQADHRGEHHEPAKQAEDQELGCSIRPARPGPKPPIRKYIGTKMTSKNT